MKLFFLKLFGDRLVKLTLARHYHEEWITIVGHNLRKVGTVKTLDFKLVGWLNENKIKVFHYYWQGNVYLFFLKSADAILFKLTW